jgi:hypothetical protein
MNFAREDRLLQAYAQACLCECILVCRRACLYAYLLACCLACKYACLLCWGAGRLPAESLGRYKQLCL